MAYDPDTPNWFKSLAIGCIVLLLSLGAPMRPMLLSLLADFLLFLPAIAKFLK
jgi:hypothetical protein